MALGERRADGGEELPRIARRSDGGPLHGELRQGEAAGPGPRRGGVGEEPPRPFRPEVRWPDGHAPCRSAYCCSVPSPPARWGARSSTPAPSAGSSEEVVGPEEGSGGAQDAAPPVPRSAGSEEIAGLRKTVADLGSDSDRLKSEQLAVSSRLDEAQAEVKRVTDRQAEQETGAPGEPARAMQDIDKRMAALEGKAGTAGGAPTAGAPARRPLRPPRRSRRPGRARRRCTNTPSGR